MIKYWIFCYYLLDLDCATSYIKNTKNCFYLVLQFSKYTPLLLNPKMSDNTSTRNVLLALEDNWFKSGNEHAIKVAHLLKSALADRDVKELEPNTDKQCEPPTGLCLATSDKEDQ